MKLGEVVRGRVLLRSVFHLGGNSLRVWGNSRRDQRQVARKWSANLNSMGCTTSMPSQCRDGKTMAVYHPLLEKRFAYHLSSSWIPPLYREQRKTENTTPFSPVPSRVLIFSPRMPWRHRSCATADRQHPPPDPDCVSQDMAKSLTNQSLGIFCQHQNRISELCEHPMSHKYGATGSMTPSTGWVEIRAMYKDECCPASL